MSVITGDLAPSQFDPRSSDYIRDPHAAVQGLFETAPVFFCEPLGAYFVAGYDEARRVLRDSELFSSHAYKGLPVRDDLRSQIPLEWERVGQVIQGGQLINMDPPAHPGQRRAMQRTFTPKRVEATGPSIATIVDELIDGIAERGTCDLMKDFATQLTVRVVGTMLAVPPEMIPDFLAWIGDVFTILAPIDLKAEDVTIPDEQLVSTLR